MARKMKKFSAGGAQGRYERRMADIEKDYAKAAARKTGKAAEVAEAKRQQRIADAKDDLAKRTGADRTATRAAEKAAEGNLTKTRKYGAAQSVTKDTAGPTGKITDTLGALTAPKSGLATAAKKPVQKPVQKPVNTPVKQDKPKDRYYVSPENRAAIDAAAKKTPVSKFDRQAFVDLKVAAERGKPVNSQHPKLARMRAIAEAPGASRAAIYDYRRAVESNRYNKAKGGTVKKETTMNKKPMPMKKKPMPKEPITGGANTVPLTPGRKEFLKELAERNAKPGMAKGGKATKFGAAMTKKSADTKGRAMVKKCSGGSMKKYAKGGSIDGIAKKGKTKGKVV